MGSLESHDLSQTLSKAFDMSKATAKVSPKLLRGDDQELGRKARRSPVERLYGNRTGDQKEGWKLRDDYGFSC